MKKETAFRLWLNKVWFEHKTEILDVTRKPCDYDLKDYFNKYKWWLKREFKSRGDS